MERQSSNPGGAKENFFCCFWISSPRVFLCFSARVALKCLTVHFSMLIERSLLPTAQHFFHVAHKPSGAMQPPQSALSLCSLGQGSSRGWGNEGISAKCILLRSDQLQNCESSDGKKSGVNGPELGDNFIRTGCEGAASSWEIAVGSIEGNRAEVVSWNTVSLQAELAQRGCVRLTLSQLAPARGTSAPQPHCSWQHCPGCGGAALALWFLGQSKELSSLSLRLSLGKRLRPAASPEM